MLSQEELDKEFIQTENKHGIPYKIMKDVSFNVIPDFRNELNLNYLSSQTCRHNNYIFLKKLIEFGLDVNGAYYLIGSTLLHIACDHNSYECAKLLIEKGVDVNVKDSFERTPLHNACRINAYECVELLIDHGADVNIKDDHEKAALYFAKTHTDKKAFVLLIKNGAHE